MSNLIALYLSQEEKAVRQMVVAFRVSVVSTIVGAIAYVVAAFVILIIFLFSVASSIGQRCELYPEIRFRFILWTTSTIDPMSHEHRIHRVRYFTRKSNKMCVFSSVSKPELCGVGTRFQRLPRAVLPRNYALRMQPQLEPPFTFIGSVRIDIKVFLSYEYYTNNWDHNTSKISHKNGINFVAMVASKCWIGLGKCFEHHFSFFGIEHTQYSN